MDVLPLLPNLKTGESKESSIRLLYVGKIEGKKLKRIAKSICECEATPEKRHDSRQFWITSGSPTTKSIV
jgi:hypothetical protein